MDGQRQIDTGEDILKRTVALLFSLATICDSVANRSYPIRFFILWLLGRAEHIAWGHIPDDVFAPFAEGRRYSRLHAQYFAWLFRTAAISLKRRLRREERFARKWARFESRPEPGDEPEARVCNLLPGSVRPLLNALRDLFRTPAPRLDSS